MSLFQIVTWATWRLVCLFFLRNSKRKRKTSIDIRQVFRYEMILCSRTISFAVQHFHLFKQPWRCFGGLDTSPSSVMRNAEVQTIYTETLNISKQGRLEVRCPFNLYVTPINHKDFPRLDKAFFTIYGNKNSLISSFFFHFLNKRRQWFSILERNLEQIV